MPPAVLDLLRRPNPAVVATVGSAGAPISAAVWYLWDEGSVLLTMSGTSPRRRQLTRDPRVTLTVLDGDDWYRQVTVHGTAEQVDDDRGLAVIDRISQHYEGAPFEDRERNHAFARVRVTEWNAFGV